MESSLVASTLVQAASGSSYSTTATQQLQQWSLDPRLCYALLEIVAARETYPTELRQLAALQLKHSIGQVWLSSVVAQGADYQQWLRRELIRSTYTEPSNVVGVQMALALCQVSLAEAYQTPDTHPDAENERWATLRDLLDRLFAHARVAEKYAECDLTDDEGELAGALLAAQRLLLPLHLLLKHLCHQYTLAADERRRQKRSNRLRDRQSTVDTAASAVATPALPSLHPTAVLDDSELPKLTDMAVNSLATNIAPILVTIIASKWQYATQLLLATLMQEQLSRGQPSEHETLYHFEELSNICLLCIKVLRRLITAHIGHSDDPDIVSVFDVSQSLLSSEVVEGVLKALPEHMSGMLNRRISVTSDTVREKLEKHILTATKMILTLTEEAGDEYARFAPSFVAFYAKQLSQCPDIDAFPPAPSFERSFASQCLMVLAETMEARKPAYDLAIRQCISSGGSFGTGLYQLLHLLLTRFLVLSRDDLELWEAEPNQFIFEDLASSFVYKLNRSAEFLFVATMRNYTEESPQVLVQLMQQHLFSTIEADEATRSSDIAIVVREACYHAVQHCYNELQPPNLHFPTFFESFLVRDLRTADLRYKLLKRRIASMFSDNWRLAVTKEMAPELYEAFISFLTVATEPYNGSGYYNDDVVVAIWSAIALRNLVDDCLSSFAAAGFLPYLERAIVGLLGLARLLEDNMVTIYVLDVVSVICMRMSEHILPYCSSIVELLGKLWQQTKEHAMLKCSVLQCLSTLLQSVGSPGIPQVGNTCLQVITISTDPTRDRDLYYVADGLKLWLSLLIVVEQEVPPSLLELGNQHLASLLALPVNPHAKPATLLRISRCYLLLPDSQFFTNHGRTLVDYLIRLFTDERTKSNVQRVALSVSSLILQLHGTAVSAHLSELLFIILRRMVAPVTKAPELPHYLAFVARFVLVDSATVLAQIQTALAEWAASQGLGLLDGLLKFWLANVEITCRDGIYTRLTLLAVTRCVTDIYQAAMGAFNMLAITTALEAFSPLLPEHGSMTPLTNENLLGRQHWEATPATAANSKIGSLYKQLWTTDVINTTDVLQAMRDAYSSVASTLPAEQHEAYASFVLLRLDKLRQLFGTSGTQPVLCPRLV